MPFLGLKGGDRNLNPPEKGKKDLLWVQVHVLRVSRGLRIKSGLP